MTKYNPDIHHRQSIRLPEYDYSTEGAYFITICTKDRECLFGAIRNGEMKLNEYGLIVNNEWKRTAEMRKNIQLDEFVIMPNHIHGIIIIEGGDTISIDDHTINGRGTMHRAPTDVDDRGRFVERFGQPTSNTIPSIIRGYKSTVTNQINKLRSTPTCPVWQRNYYEHIIRSEKSLHAIREYIINNPANWEKDELYA